MYIIVIYLILTLIFLGLNLFTYFYRYKTNKDTLIIDIKNNYNKILNLIFAGFLILLITYFCLNFALFLNPEVLKQPDLMIMINISQIIFWIAIVFFLKSTKLIKEVENIEFGYPSKKEASDGDIEIGKIFHNGKQKYPYFLKIEDLECHMFVTGITGSGKSNFLQNFLINFKKKYDIPFLLAEFKGEYHHLQKIIKDLIVFRVGNDFCINIFDSEGADPEVHAERIFEIFSSGGLFEGVEYTPQMERVFIDILNIVCKDPKKQSWKGFYNESVAYTKKMRQTEYQFNESVLAVQNRIRRYSLGSLKHIFEEKRGLNVKEVFEHNVLLDLSTIIAKGGEKEDTLFFLNMFFKYLWDKNIERGSRDYSGIKHITIIEDAQYFASNETSRRSKLTSYIEDVALLLRGTGECLISLATRPNVSNEILSNCGVFVTFQNHMQKDFLKELLNFDESEKKYLSMLYTGDCIIRVNSIGKPFAMRIPYIQRSWLKDDEIKANNKKILLSNKKESNQEDVRSIIEEKEPLVKEKKAIKTICKVCSNELEPNSKHCEKCNKIPKDRIKNDNKDFLNLTNLINELSDQEGTNQLRNTAHQGQGQKQEKKNVIDVL